VKDTTATGAMRPTTPEPAGTALERLPGRLEELGHEIRELYRSDAIPWVVGYSGGKDSTAVLQLVWQAVARLPGKERLKPIHVISTDTLVESPVVARWVQDSQESIRAAAREQGLPIQPHVLRPEVSETFWVNLIGRGYPAPRYKFRWCTERLKIRPSNRFIREVVQASGEALLVLGSRKTESSKRAASMARHEARRVRDRLSPNSKLPNSLVYTPIEDWTADEVWLYLLQVPNPWGHSNKRLLGMYRTASEDNECPLVVDTSTPSCGNSRFGCWVCTMVARDRSMEAMIDNDEEKEWMLPLLELRNELDKPDDTDRRDFRRADGRVHLFHGRPIHGPYTKVWREHWLRRVLEIWTRLRREGPPEFRSVRLITEEELHEIRHIWRHERHEFDDALPRIYEETTGEPFPGVAAQDDGLGPVEWELLREACDGEDLLTELLAHLLGTERRYRRYARRVGIHDAIEEVLRSRGYASRDEAVAEARHRQAVQEASVGEQARLPGSSQAQGGGPTG